MKISVVIPALNEAGTIQKTLDRVTSQGEEFLETIIVDGGSRDGTETVCRNYPCQVVKADKAGRAFQMNLGAGIARGDALLFLHADTLLPADAAPAIRKALQDPGICAGGFSKIFDNEHFLLRGGVARSRWRYRLLRIVSGDQGLFVRASAFHDVGGFPDVRIMEEFILCKRLRSQGRLVLLSQCVETSARRFLERGIIRCYARMALVSLLYFMRVPPALLERIYYPD